MEDKKIELLKALFEGNLDFEKIGENLYKATPTYDSCGYDESEMFIYSDKEGEIKIIDSYQKYFTQEKSYNFMIVKIEEDGTLYKKVYYQESQEVAIQYTEEPFCLESNNCIFEEDIEDEQFSTLAEKEIKLYQMKENHFI